MPSMARLPGFAKTQSRHPAAKHSLASFRPRAKLALRKRLSSPMSSRSALEALLFVGCADRASLYRD